MRKAPRAFLVVLPVVVAATISAADAPSHADTTTTLTNPAVFTLDGTSGSSSITVSGVGGLTTAVRVTLNNVSSPFPDDIDVMLVGPNGERVVLMSDVCGTDDLTNANLTVDDAAASAFPDAGPCSTGTFRPTNVDSGNNDGFPGDPTATTLAAFNGINPNGNWGLSVRDDQFGPSQSTIAGGWTLSLTTGPASMLIPGTITVGNASPYPKTVDVVGQVGTIVDLDVVLPGLTHTNPDDLDILVVAPNGQRAVLASDACGSDDIVDADVRFDDEALLPIRDDGPCVGDERVRPAAYTGDGTDTFPSPAPAGPYPTTLSVFDGINPNGTWVFYVVDDLIGGGGFLIGDPQLIITGPPQCQGSLVTVDLGAGDVPTAGNDVIRGTAGNDSINGLTGNDKICGLGGNDTIQGSAGDDVIDGGPGDDNINGGVGTDTLKGVGGNDTLQGGDGDDTIDGGAGVDVASYVSSTLPVTVTLATILAQNTVNAGLDSLHALEGVFGGSGNDKLTGNSLNNQIQGRNGNDTLIGSAGDDTLTGNAGTDTCNGGTGTDTGPTCETTLNIP